MSIAKKLMTVGAEKDVYVDDVFSTYLYEGNGVGQFIRNGIALGSAYGGNSTAFPTPEANDAIRKGDLLTGGQSSISCTFSAWVYVDPDCADNGQTLHLLRLIGNKNGSSSYPWGGFLSFNLENNGSPDTWRFNILSYAADGTKLINLNQDYSNQEYRITPGQWTHLLVSFDMTNEAAFQFCKNDAVATKFAFNAFVLANLPTANYALVNEEYFGYTSSSNRLQGNLAHVYFDYTNRDLNVEANRRLFITADGQPAAGQASLSPIIYLPLTGGPVTNNEGTGGDFTEVDGGVEVVNGFGPANASSEGEGGMVWLKRRDTYEDHYLHDTERGTGVRLLSNSTSAEQTVGLSSFNADGFSVAASQYITSGAEYASWTFRKAKNFFDVVTYTGDGVGSGREIPHGLGCRAGMVVIKRTDASSDWVVQHIGNNQSASANTANYVLHLNSSDARATSGPTINFNESYFNVVGEGQGIAADRCTNINGAQYVAYVFAHDDSDESMIKCGSYTGNGTNDGPEVDLGFEPQWLLVKKAEAGGFAESWHIFDTMRGWSNAGDDDHALYADDAVAESQKASEQRVDILPTGFKPMSSDQSVNGPNYNYIYMAIRRPNKPAEEFEADELFAVAPRNNGWTSGFPTDMAIETTVTSSQDNRIVSRLTGKYQQWTNLSAVQNDDSTITWDHMDGWAKSYQSSNSNQISWMWRRVPGFLDVVAYSSSGQVGAEIPHNLTVAPEMIWVKNRTSAYSWNVYHSALTASKYIRLNTNGALVDDTESWNGVEPTESVFTLGDDGAVNLSGSNYIAYLFASVPGVSKIGSYTGDGSTSKDIDCGFSNGARFVMIKRIDSAGYDWNIWDTVRGITAGNDPKLILNSASAQYSSADYLDPLASGFKIVTNGTDLNQSGGTYIFYAIA